MKTRVKTFSRQNFSVVWDITCISPFTYILFILFSAHALPLFQSEQGRSLKRKREKARADPVLSRKPEPPLPNKGAGGRVGVGSSIGSYVRKIAALEKVTDKDVDPREALLKYAKEAADNPYWVAPAYQR